MKLNKLLSAVCLASAFSCPLFTTNAIAADIPTSAGYDNRIRTVDYNKYDVVELVAKPGVVTHVIFEDGEVYKAHALGDGDAWHIGNFENNLFIKPAAPLGTTNLSVITNKRRYTFKLIFNRSSASASDMYQVEFAYPDTTKLLQAKQEIDKRFDASTSTKVFNLNYTMMGTGNIVPLNVYDDGTFTYFKFGASTELPAIYAIVGTDEDAKEILVNQTVKGGGNEMMVMHKINPHWRLRLGDEVLDIFNESKFDTATLNESGTIAPDVERVVIDEDKE